jgi:hypothetical protein
MAGVYNCTPCLPTLVAEKTGIHTSHRDITSFAVL